MKQTLPVILCIGLLSSVACKKKDEAKGANQQPEQPKQEQTQQPVADNQTQTPAPAPTQQNPTPPTIPNNPNQGGNPGQNPTPGQSPSVEASNYSLIIHPGKTHLKNAGSMKVEFYCESSYEIFNFESGDEALQSLSLSKDSFDGCTTGELTVYLQTSEDNSSWYQTEMPLKNLIRQDGTKMIIDVNVEDYLKEEYRIY